MNEYDEEEEDEIYELCMVCGQDKPNYEGDYYNIGWVCDDCAEKLDQCFFCKAKREVKNEL